MPPGYFYQGGKSMIYAEMAVKAAILLLAATAAILVAIDTLRGGRP